MNEERRYDILLRNQLVNGDTDVADKIFSIGTYNTFVKNETIIEQGDSDDYVYFILSGDVNVYVNNVKIDSRGSTQTVGEMAAKKAGEKRTGDVIVVSDLLETIAVAGTDFRNIMASFPKFTENLEELIDQMGRAKIEQLGTVESSKTLPWWIVSGIVSIAISFIALSIVWLLDFDVKTVLLTFISTILPVYIVVWTLNPAHRYRTLSVLAGYSLIPYIVYGTVSVSLSFDGAKVNFMLIDFGVNTWSKVLMYLIGALILLGLCWLGGILDLKLNKKDG